MNYLEPLNKCHDILKDTEGVNYIILCADATDDDEPEFRGGSGWHVDKDMPSPSFFAMISGIIWNFMEASRLSYTDRLKLCKEFNQDLLMVITSGQDKGEKDEAEI